MQVNLTISKKHIVITIVALLIVAAGLLWFLKFDDAQTAQESFPDFEAQQEVIGTYQELAKSKGVAAAYAKLKVDYASRQTEGHDYAHVIGKLAYEQMGNEGVSVCDTDLGFGCYHGLFEALVRDQGTAGFAIATDSCNKLGLPGLVASCLHGIGHGVMGLRGNIGKAIDDCKTFKDSERTYCYDGAYMEYYTGIVDVDRSTLQINTSDPWQFCLGQYAEAQSQCVRNHSFSALYQGHQPEIAMWCGKLTNSAAREQCSGTTGLWAVQANSNLEEVRSICGSFVDTTDKRNCLVYAGRELVFQRRADQARELCQSDPSIIQSCTEAIDQMAREYGS